MNVSYQFRRLKRADLLTSLGQELCLGVALRGSETCMIATSIIAGSGSND